MIEFDLHVMASWELTSYLNEPGSRFMLIAPIERYEEMEFQQNDEEFTFNEYELDDDLEDDAVIFYAFVN
jgi:hypothetical protein